MKSGEGLGGVEELPHYQTTTVSKWVWAYQRLAKTVSFRIVCAGVPWPRPAAVRRPIARAPGPRPSCHKTRAESPASAHQQRPKCAHLRTVSCHSWAGWVGRLDRKEGPSRWKKVEGRLVPNGGLPGPTERGDASCDCSCCCCCCCCCCFGCRLMRLSRRLRKAKDNIVHIQISGCFEWLPGWLSN